MWKGARRGEPECLPTPDQHAPTRVRHRPRRARHVGANLLDVILDGRGQAVQPQRTRQHYIFGYGSLMDRASRTATTPQAWAAYPVIVQDIARGWWIYGTPIGAKGCFLSAMATPGARCNGVIYPVSDVELAQTDQREVTYDRVPIKPENITFLDGRRALPDGADVWFYSLPQGASVEHSRATAQYPIVQSYVDTCLNGCLELEMLYPLAQDQQFARMFITETRDWSRHWVNDRLYPRQPFIAVPRSLQIDTLLHELLPDLYSNIKSERGEWSP